MVLGPAAFCIEGVQAGVLHLLPGILGDCHVGAAVGEGPARDFHVAQVIEVECAVIGTEHHVSVVHAAVPRGNQGRRDGAGDPGAGAVAGGVRGADVSMESTSDYWRIWYYVLEAAGLDARWLARLTEMGLLRASFVPPAAIRELREYTRMRVRLVHDRTGATSGWKSCWRARWPRSRSPTTSGPPSRTARPRSTISWPSSPIRRRRPAPAPRQLATPGTILPVIDVRRKNQAKTGQSDSTERPRRCCRSSRC